MKDDQGRALRESNAHIVEWEDGSQDLYVGDNIIRLKVVNDATNSQCFFVNQVCFGMNTHFFSSKPNKCTFQANVCVCLKNDESR